MGENEANSLWEASQSDQPALSQRMAHSRNTRKRHRLSSAFIAARTLRWNKRQRKSLLNCPVQPTISEDESDDAPTLPTLQRTKKNLAALKLLPRPSEVIAEVEAGSAAEAGLSSKLKQVYNRRVKATTLRMQYLSTQGKPQPVPSWSRINRGLTAYSSYLQPPAEDRQLRLLRTPRQLLSRYYRGSLLKVYKLGDRRCIKRQRTNSGFLSSYPTESMVDLMYWATTSDEYTNTEKEIQIALHESKATSRGKQTARQYPSKQRFPGDELGQNVPVLATAVDIEARRSEAEALLSKIREEFQKHVYVQQVKNLAQTDDDSLQSGTDTSSLAPSPLPAEVTCDEDVNQQKKEEEDPEKIQDRELLRLLQGDTDDEIEMPENRNQRCTKEEDLIVPHKVENAIECEQQTKSKQKTVEQKKLSSLFEKDREIAIEFCQAKNKRSRAEAFLDAAALLPADARRSTHASKTIKSKESYGMKLLKKMGFSGRLGARENGCSAPPEATIKVHRLGLGAQSKGPISYARHLLSEYEMNQTQDRGRNSIPVDIHHGPVEAEKHLTTEYAAPIVSTPSARSGQDKKEVFAMLPSRNARPDLRRDNDNQDPEDEWETEVEDKAIDNLRRAMIIDMGAIVKNSHERREMAFQAMLSKSEELSFKEFNLNDVCAKVGHDLNDEEAIIELLERSHIAVSEEKVKTFMDRLDVCYEGLGSCELIEDFWSCGIAGVVHCGLFHRGSQQRVEREVKSLGLLEVDFLFFVPQTRERWPYTKTWKDIFCQLGVPPRQGGIVTLQTAQMNSGRVAAAILGTQVETCSSTSSKDSRTKASPVPALKAIQCMLEKLQNANLASLPRRRRVFFFSEEDKMWYGGCVQFEQGSRALVHDYRSSKMALKDVKSLVGLSRVNFKKLKTIDFGGLFEPEDVECL